jgi:hypothetical protein
MKSSNGIYLTREERLESRLTDFERSLESLIAIVADVRSRVEELELNRPSCAIWSPFPNPERFSE